MENIIYPSVYLMENRLLRPAAAARPLLLLRPAVEYLFAAGLLLPPSWKRGKYSLRWPLFFTGHITKTCNTRSARVAVSSILA